MTPKYLGVTHSSTVPSRRYAWLAISGLALGTFCPYRVVLRDLLIHDGAPGISRLVTPTWFDHVLLRGRLFSPP